MTSEDDELARFIRNRAQVNAARLEVVEQKLRDYQELEREWAADRAELHRRLKAAEDRISDVLRFLAGDD